MKKRWRIRHKLAASLLLVIGMTGLLAAGSFFGLYSYRRSNNIFSYHQQQLERLGYLELAVSGLNFPSREIPGDSKSQDDARQEELDCLNRIEATLKQYRAGLQSAPDRSFTKEGTRRQFEELRKMSQTVEQLKLNVADDRPVSVANQPHHLWKIHTLRDVVARLIHSLERLRGVIHTEVTEHVEADRTNYRLSIAAVWSTTIFVLALLIGFVWLGFLAIFRPIRELYHGVTGLADGNFNSRVSLDSGDELEELGNAFNEMADRLKGTYDELNDQVRERSRQLIRSERLASVGFLAAGVAHEINNPLASIAFCAEALEGRLRDSLETDSEQIEVVHNYLTMIQQEAFRCKGITEKLLDFSRVGDPERVETDISGLIRNVIEMVQHLGRANGKDLVYEPGAAVHARVNPQELKQVLLNLVINALESVDEQGTVVIRTRVVENNIEIEVRDNGCGMSRDVLDNLFEPFFTRNRSGRGTGLGLSISHLIVSQHGGTLDAFSEGEGKGSTLCIRLPMEAKVKEQVLMQAA